MSEESPLYICPLLQAPCKTFDCAWWAENSDAAVLGCSVVVIATALDSIDSVGLGQRKETE